MRHFAHLKQSRISKLFRGGPRTSTFQGEGEEGERERGLEKWNGGRKREGGGEVKGGEEGGPQPKMSQYNSDKE